MTNVTTGSDKQHLSDKTKNLYVRTKERWKISTISNTIQRERAEF